MYIYRLARIRLLGRFTTCLAQTTTASRLLFALGWHFMPQECDFFFEIFEYKSFKILYLGQMRIKLINLYKIDIYSSKCIQTHFIQLPHGPPPCISEKLASSA